MGADPPTAQPFLMLKPEERLPKDQPNGGDNLVAHYKLDGPLAESVNQKPLDYLMHVPGDTRIYRGKTIDEAEEMGLSSLAGLFPASNRPPIQAIPDELLTKAFNFNPSIVKLPEEKKGVPVPSTFERGANGESHAAPTLSNAGGEHSAGGKRKKEKKD
eukprot:CAMPEP_0177774448 /NCGR_PEP_ID=MMETSP0491_2-20121128/13506_1 /TAXON_ID=63592 /ORGANISM="Tetraselmis chuii, Strain PLY429" /LENGTH=158 /DNA_ID=CAMNT_0019292815 /DNA_START=335 /DNA_END=808 /DNA_ORIENTATION=-